ncbi:MAG: helix-turn-helix domain-containing protein [Pseudonocardiales bacterium]|nr:helix-turn-helix domain-containing protein [Pseudonocardiales bacterium]
MDASSVARQRAKDAPDPRCSLARHEPVRGLAGDDNTYLITTEVAALLRTSPETVRYWRHIGKGPRSFRAGRKILYARVDVEAWIRLLRGVA